MINKKTVLILGAGASAHVGYPLGRQLVDNICGQSKTILTDEISDVWGEEEVNGFISRLSRAGFYSIDAFLETVSEQASLGKYLLAREIKRHEQIGNLFSPKDPGWYQYLFNCLLDDNSYSGFESSQLSIVTFNYDRSLETYLHEALIARFQVNPEEAHDILSKIHIIHVHGSLGKYPTVPYQADCSTEELLEISKEIQIIHEVKDPENGFCNKEFEDAFNLLSGAERIFFLGFGFHPDNIRRFNFFSPENTKGREIWGTVQGMGSVDIKDLSARLEERGISQTSLNGNACNNFFSHVAGLK